MKKIVLPGLLAGTFMLVAGMINGQLFNQLFPSLASEYLNTSLFRDMKDPLMALYFLHPFVLGLILAWVWNIVKPAISGKTTVMHGLRFGFIYAMLGIPGMLISYGSFQLSFLMILSWTIGIFIQGLGAGIVVASVNK